MGLTLHERVRRHLRELVECRFEDGERFYSERELINRLGVSQPTIRRAMLELTAEGLLTRGVGKGTFVQKSVRDRSVGILVPQLDMFLQLSIVQTLAVLCAERHLGFHLYHIQPKRAMRDVCKALRRPPSEERIIFEGTSREATLDLYHELEGRGYRSLYLNGLVEGYPGSSVREDVEGGVKLAFEHLRSLGHRRIAFVVNEPTSLAAIKLRLESIRMAISSDNLNDAVIFDCDLDTWDDSFTAAYNKMAEVMALSPRPTAICPISGAGSLAALRFLTKHRIRVPEDVSLFSFDDLPACRHLCPSVTALTCSPELEKKALDILWTESRRVQAGAIPSRLVARESTGPACP
jgi:LacI family transcriptional regulator